MKVKITRAQLAELVKEEVDRFKHIQELESKKAQLSEAIKKLNEGEDIDESIFSGMKHLFNKGASAAGQSIQKGAQQAWQGTKALGQDFVDVGKQAVQGVQDAGQQIKQTYQQGDRDGQVSSAQKSINAAYQEKRALEAKIKALQAKHQQLTGQVYTPQKFGYKAPASAMPINKAAE